jgi:hypothetical protein
MLTVTVIDNKPILDGQFGGDTLELVFRQDYDMTFSGAGVATEILDGVCNQAAQDAGSTVTAGVNVSSTFVPRPLLGACAPFGRFLDVAISQAPITPGMFFQGGLFFNFREGAAGQAITLPFIMSVSVPEPTTLILLGLGLAGLEWKMRKRY